MASRVRVRVRPRRGPMMRQVAASAGVMVVSLVGGGCGEERPGVGWVGGGEAVGCAASVLGGVAVEEFVSDGVGDGGGVGGVGVGVDVVGAEAGEGVAGVEVGAVDDDVGGVEAGLGEEGGGVELLLPAGVVEFVVVEGVGVGAGLMVVAGGGLVGELFGEGDGVGAHGVGS